MTKPERGKCTQIQAVRWLLSDGEWWTLAGLTCQCRQFVGASEAGVSARIRDLRKEGKQIERVPVRKGAKEYKYRMLTEGQRKTPVAVDVDAKLSANASSSGAGERLDQHLDQTAAAEPPAPVSSSQGELFGDGTARPPFSQGDYPD